MTRLARNPVARRVLVIEDDPGVAELLRHVLVWWGWDVRVAGDGVQGLEAARAFLPRVVICDIGLPRLDGYGVARALRADPTLDGIYAIALTAFTSPIDQERARVAGFDLHVAKPVTLEVLQHALHGSGAHQANSASRDARKCPLCREATKASIGDLES